jgi:cytochrome c-type biogenesis protein CcmH
MFCPFCRRPPMRLSIFCKITLICMGFSCGAVANFTPLGTLSDPALEARAKALSLMVKCPTCKGQCIADSNAAMAQDLRLFVREGVMKGASDQEILDALVARFGPSVLFDPPLLPQTAFLWGAPFLFAGAGILLVLRARRAARARRPV